MAEADAKQLVEDLQARPASEAARLLDGVPPAIACEALTQLNPAFTQDILAELPEVERHSITNSAPVA